MPRRPAPPSPASAGTRGHCVIRDVEDDSTWALVWEDSAGGDHSVRLSAPADDADAALIEAHRLSGGRDVEFLG